MMKYKKYKSSGVEWIGDIPEHWEVKRIKDILKNPLKYGANEPAVDDDRNNPRYIRITDFGENEILRDDTFKSVKYEIAKNYLLKKGDILFARSGATVGKSFQFKNYNGLACYAGYLIKATPNSKIVISDFLSYYTKSISYDEWKENIFIQATIQNISAEKYDRLELPVPPLSEQTAIAQYLDAKTQAIDKKINLLTKKTETYKELRKSMINDAVCKGLDKSVKLKESGIDWIGKIPEHWEVRRLKDAVQLNVSNIDKHIREDEKSVLLCNYTDVYKNNFITSDLEFMISTASDAQIQRFSLKKGDILITKDSESFDDIAVPAIVTEELPNVVCGYHLALIRVEKEVCPGYLYNLFRSSLFNYNFSKQAKGITRVGLSINSINDTFLILPPIEEQRAISNYLDEKTQKIDAIVSNIGKQIDTLKELRKALINDVVTGKIKVSEPLIDID